MKWALSENNRRQIEKEWQQAVYNHGGIYPEHLCPTFANAILPDLGILSVALMIEMALFAILVALDTLSASRGRILYRKSSTNIRSETGDSDLE